MEIKEPEFRCGRNLDELAALFNYKIDKGDQDWTYTIVEPDRIDEYIQAYDTIVTNEDTKFSLMEMIIQSIEDQETDEMMFEKWEIVKDILNRDFELHMYTIFYWCCWEDQDLNDCWSISSLMRELWLNKK